MKSESKLAEIAKGALIVGGSVALSLGIGANLSSAEQNILTPKQLRIIEKLGDYGRHEVYLKGIEEVERGEERQTRALEILYFTCNYVEDLNGNGRLDIPEDFGGVKDSFGENEKIVLVSYDLRNIKGKHKLGLEIYGHRGLIHKEEKILLFAKDKEVNHIGNDFDLTKFLIERGGYGSFKAVWRIDGRYDGSTEFEIVPSR